MTSRRPAGSEPGSPPDHHLELPATFNHRGAEERIRRLWEAGDSFAASAQDAKKREPYVIVIPPPNVTAVLHMGHGLNNTIQDVLIRWRRMQGRTALWVPGTDHAGIATQNVVERRLAAEGKTRYDLGREAFARRVWDHVEPTGERILAQLKAIGCSCDWNRARFTLDEGLTRSVREIFVRLYEDDLIYRGRYVINWCPRCLTALSNEEAEGSERKGHLWHLRYPLAPGHETAAARTQAAGAQSVGRLPDGRWYLVVSTTRPETMLGDTGVAVGPGDDRYRGLVGAVVELPLTGRKVPIVADESVRADFGTGIVKVTPAHDLSDFEIAARTGLEVLDIMTERATTNDNVPQPFRGLRRSDARSAVLSALEAEGLVAGRDAHLHTVPRCYRCDALVEPRLSEQWFVRMKALAQPALEASRTGAVTFAPLRWTRVYERWMEDIRDWCISRQLWWGHRIPVWYCQDCGHVSVPREDPESCASCGSTLLEQDPDVLDTWFSSWLWPFSVFGWPGESEDLETFYPGHALSTAPEILFFWVARMIMSGCHVMGEVPFQRVYLHGTVRDTQGRKMSKSLGNGIDPMEVVERYGADALRFTLVAGAGVGADIRLDPKNLEAAFAPGRNFVNKLWNAGRFVVMSLGKDPVLPLEEAAGEFQLEDRWILSRLQFAARRADEELEAFRMHGAAEVLRELFWSEFADWYLESVKDRLQENGPGRKVACSVLRHVLEEVIRLLHPIVPFVTEELWSLLPGSEDGDNRRLLIVAPWPEPSRELVDEEAERRFKWLQELVVRVRSLRKEYRVGEGQEVSLLVTGGSRAHVLKGREAFLRRLARVGSVEASAPAPGAVGASAVLQDGTELFLPLEGVIDVNRERNRLTREIERLMVGLKRSRARLANDKFVGRAPSDVVEREREKADSWARRVRKLQEKRASLEGA